jgi:hypothetical protein
VTLKSSTVARNAAADAICDLADSGLVRIYTATRPANPQTAAAGTLLATLTLNATAFGAAVAGVATANAITSDSSADDTGTAAWFRVLQSDGTTVLWDGDVTATGGGGDITFSTVAFVAAAVIAMTSLSYTEPE